MVALNGYTATPHHRQNRRRERPGSRTRRTLNRKANIQSDCYEGLLDARDIEVPLPSDKTRPSPLLRQNFDQSWQRWKAREAGARALVEMDKMQLEEEQRRLFGGDVGDDELYQMGILYNEEDEFLAQDEDTNPVLCGVPLKLEQPSFPMFVLRRGRPRRSRRRSTWRSLPPLYLSCSGLSDDDDIKRLLSPSVLPMTTIQHREFSKPTPISIFKDIPLSLPPPSAFEGLCDSVSGSPISVSSEDDTISIPPTPSPALISLQTLPQGDWTFIDTDDTLNNTPILPSPTPCPTHSTSEEEPETWILIDDS